MQKFIKNFSNVDRFYSEEYFFNVFKQLGFNVPERVGYDIISYKIIYKFIEKDRKLNIIDCYKIVNILFSIYENKNHILNINYKTAEYIKHKYISNSIDILDKNMYLSENTRIKLINLFNDNFIYSIFKDAKYDNWLIENNNIIMIDFDYIVYSFFLSDLAQFVTTIDLFLVKIFNNDLYLFFLEKFLLKIFITPINKNIYKIYIKLFLISCLHSNFQKSLFNRNYDLKSIEIQNNIIINKLDSIL